MTIEKCGKGFDMEYGNWGGVWANEPYIGKIKMIDSYRGYATGFVYEIIGYAPCDHQCGITQCCGKPIIINGSPFPECMTFGNFRCYSKFDGPTIQKKSRRLIRLE